VPTLCPGIAARRGCEALFCDAVVAIAARGFHGCALLGEGNVRCWGDDIHGELGDGSHGRSGEVPVEVVGL
jgi:hypothetical protein